MPLGSLDALGTIWLPLAIGVFIAVSHTVENRHSNPALSSRQFTVRPGRCGLLIAPFAWQIYAHSTDHLLERLLGELLVLGIGVALGLLLLAAVSAIAKLLLPRE
ncbi:hypothetical protein [Streptomyces nanshensis]|uniref:Uncharacterized protein n=1 Tax=Streptomyces nanshensis TaxID=518642 RepID=A0A1E7KZ66_9ACTN|nr:hypothetical protein [Streptomyces nanshensis]OEV09220.1 hypothetical protein AN218_22355 [Streptomyces nanshensis]